MAHRNSGVSYPCPGDSMKWIDFIACGLLVAALAVGTYERNQIWHDGELAIWEDIVGKSPNKVRALSNYGASLIMEHRFIEAVSPLLRASKLAKGDPQYYYIWYNLSVAYEQIGDLHNAYKYAHEAAVLQKDTNTLTQLGLILKRMGWKAEEKKE